MTSLSERSAYGSTDPGADGHAARDLMGEVLSSLKVAEADIALFEFTAPWTLRVRQAKPLVCTITQGTLWLKQGRLPAESYGPGDTFVMPRGFCGADILVSSAATMPGQPIGTDRIWNEGRFVPVHSDLKATPLKKLELGGPGTDRMCALSFTFDWEDRLYGPMVADLPLVLRQNASATGANILSFFTDMHMTEVAPDQPGFRFLAAQAAQLFLAHVVRSHSQDHSRTAPGWMKGLTEPRISRSIEAIHAAPGTPWSVERLARLSGMSRAVFALRFQSIMGVPPMDYLRSWRMHLARRALALGGTTVSNLSSELGYRSEAGFREAFRRSCGMSPQEFARSAAHQAAAPRDEIQTELSVKKTAQADRVGFSTQDMAE